MLVEAAGGHYGDLFSMLVLTASGKYGDRLHVGSDS